MTAEYDLITIGAGSGGVAASRRAAAHGARVLIVEGDRVGGTCVIRGCVPKKLMMYAAGFSGALREAAGFGWTGISGRFEMARWADAKAREIDRLEGIYRDMLAASGVELAVGQAQVHRSGHHRNSPDAAPARRESWSPPAARRRPRASRASASR